MGKAGKGAPSRQKVACGYEGCNYEGELRNMKSHNMRKHGGGPRRLKNISFGVGGRYQSWRRSDQQVQAVQKADTIPEQPSGAGPDETFGAGDDCPVVSTPADMEVDRDQHMMPRTAAAGPAETCLAQDECPVVSTPSGMVVDRNQHMTPGTAAADVSAKTAARSLTERVASLEKDRNKVFQLLESSTAVPSACHESSDIEAAVRSARSLESLRKACGGLLVASTDADSFFCSCCATEPSTNTSLGATGVFAYDFAQGTAFSHAEHLPVSFRRLKEAVRRHFASERHAEAQKAVEAKQKELSAREKEAGTIALRVLRTAYRVIKRSLPHVLFEELIVLQDMNGLNMGDINHSKAFMVRARESFTAEILHKVAEHVKDQPCVSLVCDKVTINHRTVDITAVTTLVPGAPVGRKVQCLVIGAPVVKKHGGDEHSRQLQATLASVGISRAEQLSAIAADGQVHHNSVPSKLLKAMIANDITQSGAHVPCVWDCSHLMNLADSDARSGAKGLWVNSAIATITRISKRFSHGSGLEKLLEAGEELGCQVLRPKLWSETRFAPHAAEVISTFKTNIPAMKRVLEERLSSEPKSGVRGELQTDLRALKDRELGERLAALLDVYRVLASGSRMQQQVQSLPWQTMTNFGNTISTLRRMSLVMKDPAARTEAEAEMVGFTDMADVCPELAALGSRSKDVMKDASGFCESLARELRHRRGGRSTTGSRYGTDNQALMEAMVDIKDVANLEQVRDGSIGNVAIIESAASRLVARRIVPPSCRLSRESAAAGYRVLHEPRCAEGCNQQLLGVLWASRDSVPALRPYVELVIRLWLIWPTESVVESMGSAVGEVFGVHRQLDHANAARELVVRWNGPDPCKADDLIRAVQRKTDFRFVRRTTGIHKTMAGTVITRHKNAASDTCALFTYK